MVCKALIILDGVEKELLESIYLALKPEEYCKVRGVRTTLLRTDEPPKLLISVEAPTLNSLRATSNSIIRLVRLAIDVIRDLK